MQPPQFEGEGWPREVTLRNAETFVKCNYVWGLYAAWSCEVLLRWSDIQQFHLKDILLLIAALQTLRKSTEISSLETALKLQGCFLPLTGINRRHVYLFHFQLSENSAQPMVWRCRKECSVAGYHILSHEHVCQINIFVP